MKTKNDGFSSGALPFGGFPFPARKIGITISGLEEWKDGVVTGTTVQVDILQNGKAIHSEVFSGKASGQFTREVIINASSADLVAAHNRPDLPGLKVSVNFVVERQPFKISNGTVFIKESVIRGAISDCQASMSVGITTTKSHSDKIREIVSKYLTGEASEYEDDLVDELNALHETENLSDCLSEKISECVRQSLIQEMKPGGLLFRR